EYLRCHLSRVSGKRSRCLNSFDHARAHEAWLHGNNVYVTSAQPVPQARQICCKSCLGASVKIVALPSPFASYRTDAHDGTLSTFFKIIGNGIKNRNSASVVCKKYALTFIPVGQGPGV